MYTVHLKYVEGSTAHLPVPTFFLCRRAEIGLGGPGRLASPDSWGVDQTSKGL